MHRAALDGGLITTDRALPRRRTHFASPPEHPHVTVEAQSESRSGYFRKQVISRLCSQVAVSSANAHVRSSARLPSPVRQLNNCCLVLTYSSQDPARSSSSSRPSTIPSGSLSPDPFPDSAMAQEPSNHAAVPPPAATAPAVSGTSSDDEDYVDISTSDYAKKRKGLMELNRDLRALG
jgi:hypothetical protein